MDALGLDRADLIDFDDFNDFNDFDDFDDFEAVGRFLSIDGGTYGALEGSLGSGVGVFGVTSFGIGARFLFFD